MKIQDLISGLSSNKRRVRSLTTGRYPWGPSKFQSDFRIELMCTLPDGRTPTAFGPKFLSSSNGVITFSDNRP